jgi:NAD(P)-dependent dehydrogenase (short-subunit alcohol dehydrogenase family)
MVGINAAAMAMREKGIKGSILVTTGVFVHDARKRRACAATFEASKAPVEMFVKYAALEHGEAGVRATRPCLLEPPFHTRFAFHVPGNMYW